VDGFSHSIHKANEIGPQSTKGVSSEYARGSVLGIQGDTFASKSGGIMEMVMWL
jgi:hypothetical protein